MGFRFFRFTLYLVRWFNIILFHNIIFCLIFDIWLWYTIRGSFLLFICRHWTTINRSLILKNKIDVGNLVYSRLISQQSFSRFISSRLNSLVLYSSLFRQLKLPAKLLLSILTAWDARQFYSKIWEKTYDVFFDRSDTILRPKFNSKRRTVLFSLYCAFSIESSEAYWLTRYLF